MALSYIILFTVSSPAFAATAPDPPTNPVATAVSPTQVNLFWTPPTNNGGSGINTYKIEYKVGSGNYLVLIGATSGPVTDYSHTGLTTGTAYTYRISATNNFGTSNPSVEVSATPTSSSTGTLPGAPQNLVGVAASPTQANLSWNPPTNNGGYPITGYKIDYRVSSGSYTTLVSNTASTTTTYSHTGLVTNQVYVYRIYSITSFGTGTVSSNEVVVQPTSSSSLTVPGAPTGLSGVPVSPTQVNLSWTAPSNNGGAPITSYKIEVKSGSGSYSNLVSSTGNTATAYSHTGLATGTTYTYKISAINSIGTSAASAEASATPTGSSSSANVPGSVTTLTATAASPTQVNLSWGTPSNNGGSPITGYKIEAKKGTGAFEILVSNSQSTATSFSHTGLTTGTTYYYRVSAINSVGTGAQSEISATPKETTSPTVTATAVSPTSITLTWVAPSQTYKQSITGYKIEEKIGQDSYKVIQDNVGTSTSYTIQGLTTGKTYTYVVSAYFSLGASPRSPDATATPLTTSNASPPSQTSTTNVNPPTNIVATPYSPTQINLSWTAPSTTSTIVGYKIEVKKGPGQFETLTSSTQNSTTKYSHAGVATGVAHVYRIYTITSSGTSLASSEASTTATLSTQPPAPPISAKPPTPPTLSANLVSPTQINLYWTTPTNNGGASIIGYKIEYKIGADTYRTLTSKTTSTTYSHTGLLANTYSYRIYAINQAGTSVASNEVSLKTADQKPVEQKPEPTQCGAGTIFDDATQTCILAPEPEPEVDPEPTTHIPGFPDPNKNPQDYVDRYNSEAAYKAWFDRNFPGKTIYEVVGLPEPEPPQFLCGEGTHLEDKTCVPDKKDGPFGGGCLIATASHGTELAPQVQQLREIRDGVLYRTSSGTAFMAGFNEFYYSFSPSVADLERQSPIFKELVKGIITPMLSTLSILNYVEIDSESEMLGYGIGIVLLNAGIYLVLPAFAIIAIRNKIKSGNLAKS